MTVKNRVSRLSLIKICLTVFFAIVFFATSSFAQDGIMDLKRVCNNSVAYKKLHGQWSAIVQQKTQELSLECSKTNDEKLKQRLTEECNSQLKARQMKFFLPISVEIQKVAAEVAKEKNLQAVYDIATGRNGIDITNDVISRLNAREAQKAQARTVRKAESSQSEQKPVAVQATRGNGAVQVQFGSSPNKGGVDALVAKAVKLGFSNAYACEGIDKNGRKIWRARIPVASTAEAKQISAQLTQRKINNFITQ